MKNNRGSVKNKPRGWIYGAKWAGRRCEARVCLVTVGVAPGNWWCAKMVGDTRSAIEIKLDDQTVYVDNENDWALNTLLSCKAPLPKFRFMPVFQVTDDPNKPVFYKAVPSNE